MVPVNPRPSLNLKIRNKIYLVPLNQLHHGTQHVLLSEGAPVLPCVSMDVVRDSVNVKASRLQQVRTRVQLPESSVASTSFRACMSATKDDRDQVWIAHTFSFAFGFIAGALSCVRVCSSI